MRLHGKIIGLALVAVLGIFVSGCSGLNTGTSVSPASFFLPGLLKADPPAKDRTLQVTPEPVVVVAQAQ